MGTGKTSWAIQFMKQNYHNFNMIYLTPTLSEIDRIIKATTDIDGYQTFTAPVINRGSKLNDFKNSVKADKNIATTHALFFKLDEECQQLLAEHNYVLILDETIEAISLYEFYHTDDFKYLIANGDIQVKETGLIEWIGNSELDTRFNDIRTLVKNHCLYEVDSQNVIQQFPPHIFPLFKQVYVLTYLFEGTLMYYWFKLNHMSYEKKSVELIGDNYSLVDFYEPDTSYIKDLVTICDTYNYRYSLSNKDINGNPLYTLTAFSASWYRNKKKNGALIKGLKKDMENLVKNKWHARSDEVIWTCYKESKSKVSGKRYTRVNSEASDKQPFVSLNCRGTNNYADRQYLMYTVNRYQHPAITRFFSRNDIQLDQDLLALSEMLQWIWRSRVRKGKKVQIFIPSERMRNLLKSYENGYFQNG